MVAALTVRRGLAVAAVIVVLLVSYTVVATIQGISEETGDDDGRRGRRAVLAVHAGQRRPGVPVRLPRRHGHAAEQHRDGPAVRRRGARHGARLARRPDGPLPQGRSHEHHRDRPRVPVVPQRRRGQRRVDDDRPRRHRPARAQRRRQVHADRADVRLPGAVDRHGHPGRRAAVAQRAGLPQDRPGPRAGGAVRLPDRPAVRGRLRRAARAGRRRRRGPAGDRA